MTLRIFPASALLALLLAPTSQGYASPVIYPPATSTLKFEHNSHKKTPCLSCHAGVRRSVSTVDRNLPGESACRGCHQKITRPAQGKPSNLTGCVSCHEGLKPKAIPPRTIHPPANLRFGHRVHLDKGVACGSCHTFQKGQRALPTMKTCVACHKRKRVSGRCVVCHITRKDGRLKTHFSTGELRPVDVPAGMGHGPTFRKEHARAARQGKRTCNSCHTKTSCLKCHAGSLRPMSIHSGDYVRRHAMDARRDQPRCSSCHRSQSFCLGCHQRLGVGRETKESGFAPHTGKAFHPPGFTAAQRGPGHHAHAARRNIRACSSCHRESTCIRCHGSAKSGKAGFSPHAPGFGVSAKCRALSERNRRVCLKCHQGGDAKLDCR
jgi:hypothetical protein